MAAPGHGELMRDECPKERVDTRIVHDVGYTLTLASTNP